MFMAVPIPPKEYRTATLRAYILNALVDSGREVDVDLRATVATWNHSVQFHREFRFSGGDATIRYWTDDLAWNYLNVGTHVRHAVMEFGFRAKTRTGVIGSFGGSGKMAFVNSKVNRPGITARMWSEAIYINQIVRFRQKIAQAIYKGML